MINEREEKFWQHSYIPRNSSYHPVEWRCPISSHFFNPSLKKTPKGHQRPPKLLTVFFQIYFIWRECLQDFITFFPFCFSSLAMISAQQPPFPNKIQRTMDCQSKEEETCEEQYDSENCTCSSEHAESEKGLVQFKYCNCYGMLAYHTLIFVSLQIGDIIMQLFLWYPISPIMSPYACIYYQIKPPKNTPLSP